jgi:hypothetical protein
MSGRIRLALAALCAFALLFCAADAPVNGAEYARLSISVKAPKGRTIPMTAPLKTALLVVTSSWRDVRVTTDVRRREAAGQPVGMADLSVVLSTQELDCSNVFQPAPPLAETDAENWFVLDREHGVWRVDLAASVGDARVVVKTPLTECPGESRVTSEGAPLLGERRLVETARNF